MPPAISPGSPRPPPRRPLPDSLSQCLRLYTSSTALRIAAALLHPSSRGWSSILRARTRESVAPAPQSIAAPPSAHAPHSNRAALYPTAAVKPYIPQSGPAPAAPAAHPPAANLLAGASQTQRELL